MVRTAVDKSVIYKTMMASCAQLLPHSVFPLCIMPQILSLCLKEILYI